RRAETEAGAGEPAAERRTALAQRPGVPVGEGRRRLPGVRGRGFRPRAARRAAGDAGPAARRGAGAGLARSRHAQPGPAGQPPAVRDDGRRAEGRERAGERGALQREDPGPHVRRGAGAARRGGRTTIMTTILLVEDNELNRDMLSRRLARQGYQVVQAVDGGEAISRARDSAPDLILMDLSLPVIDGWEATRRLKADEATRRIPVIALTAHAM